MVVADLPNYVDHIKYELLWFMQTGIPRALRYLATFQTTKCVKTLSEYPTGSMKILSTLSNLYA
jgi:hypothetical protein